MYILFLLLLYRLFFVVYVVHIIYLTTNLNTFAVVPSRRVNELKKK